MKRSAIFAVLALAVLLSGNFLPTSLAASQIPQKPTNIVLTIIPPKLPADSRSYAAAVVSVADAAGLPSAALVPITVFLTSSQTNIASVPDSIVIAPGQEYSIANITTTSTPGSAQITAHAEGYGAPSSVVLNTITPSGFPSKLKVFTSPSEFLPRSDTGGVRVEVVDDAGLPSKAISTINVAITSSNSSIASLDQSTLTIQAGSFYATGTFHTNSPGAAVISATSTGYSTGAALVTIDKPSVCLGQCGPSKLEMRLVPGTLPTDGQSYDVLEVGLQTQSGSPAVSSADTIVQLTSDQSEVASIPSLVTIPAGSISTLASVTTSALAGTANLTATSTGLLPTTIAIKTIIPAPSKLQAYIAPPTSAYSVNGNYPILVVQLQDSGGNPARARQNTAITVTSSNGSLISSFVSLSIPVGNDYVMSFLHIKGDGQSVLTISSQGLQTSSASLQVYPSPLQVKLALVSTANGFIFANQTATFQLTMSFLGEPIQHANVSWTASKGTIAPASTNTGTSGVVSTVLVPAGFGSYNITASSSTPATGPILATFQLTVAQVPPKPAPSLVAQLLSYWYYIVAAVAVVIIAVVYLFRMRRKKQRAEIEAGFEVV